VYPRPSGRRKNERELDYRLAKALWAFTENRIGVRFRYEWRDNAGIRDRSYGNETGAGRHRGLGSRGPPRKR
jgi:nuclear transport factor 2 (NTF2) superfamily protein